MASSVAEGRSYDEDRGGRSEQECMIVYGGTEQKCNWGHGNATSGHKSLTGT